MADVTQFTFSLAEVAELLIKSSNIHEGQWTIGMEFGINVGAMGVKPDEAYPGAMFVASKLVLTAVDGSPQPPNLVFDAAKLNPAKKESKK